MSSEHVVVDASALIDLVVSDLLGAVIESRLEDAILHAPAHVDAEILSALGRLHRSGDLAADTVSRHLDTIAAAPIERHRLTDLLGGAWSRRDLLRLADALYVELATVLGAVLVTTDARLGPAVSIAEVVSL